MNTDTKSRKLLGRMVKIGITISSVTRGLDARKLLGRLISIGVVIAAVGLGLEVLYSTNYYPRTEDLHIMLQNLLTERFKLRFHYDGRQMQAYVLTCVSVSETTALHLFFHA